MALHAEQSKIRKLVVRGILVEMVHVSPFNRLALDVALFNLLGTPWRDDQGVVRILADSVLHNVECTLERIARRAMIRPIRPPDGSRVTPIEGGESLLDSAAERIVFEPASINHGKSESAASAWVVTIDIKNHAVRPLFRVLRFNRSLEGAATILTSATGTNS